MEEIHNRFYAPGAPVNADTYRRCQEACDDAVYRIKMQHFERMHAQLTASGQTRFAWQVPLPQVADPLRLPGAQLRAAKEKAPSPARLPSSSASSSSSSSNDADNTRSGPSSTE